MNCTEIVFNINPNKSATVEILIAWLSMLDYESFTETDFGFNAYILAENFKESDIKYILGQLHNDLGDINYTFKEIKQQNWNEEWEKNFEPIIIDNKCLIYAPFHSNIEMLDYNILIKPKMTFGTGHHATTLMMIEHLLNINLEEKKVLDMGSGTGILAILASLKKADLVYAVDNDKWAYNNCIDNIAINKIDNIIAIEGDVNSIKDEFFDVILANINRNTLINDIEIYINVLKSDGLLIMSGFYVDDIPAIEQEANANDLFLKKYLEKDNWASVVFEEK